MAFSGRMATTKLQVSGRRARKSSGRKQTSFFPDGRKFTVALKPEEQILAKNLAGVIAQPGQTLNVQDVLRIGLANLGLVNLTKLEVGTDRKR